MRKHRLLASTLGFPLLFALAACGGDNGENGTNGTNGSNGTAGTATVRFLNLANGISNAVDIYRRADVQNQTNPQPIASDLAFGDLSAAVQVPAVAGSYQAFFAGSAPEGQPVFEATGLIVEADVDNVITFFTNANAATEARAFVDDLDDPTAGTGRIRFFHYAANFGDRALQIYDAANNRDPTVLTQPISFGQASADQSLLIGEFVLGFGPPSEEFPERVIEFNVTGGAFKGFLISDGSTDSLYLLDGNGNLSPPVAATDFTPPGEGLVNVVHIARGADAVDIFITEDDEQNPDPFAANVPENSAIGNRSLREGTYTVSVAPTGDTIDDAVVTLENFRVGEDDTLTLVIYDDMNGDPQIAELPEEDPTGVGAGETKFRVAHFAPALMNVSVLDAQGEPPGSLGETFDDLAFGDTTAYSSNRSVAQDIILGVDADDDPREDLEVRFNLGQFPSMSTYNVLLDSAPGVDGPDFFAILLPSGGGASSPINGTTIPDPTFIRPIHLASAYGTGADEAVDFYVDFDPVNTQGTTGSIPYLDSAPNYSEVNAGENVSVTFVSGGGSVNNGITNRNANLAKDAYQTAVLHGTRCDQGTNNCRVTILEDDPPSSMAPAGTVRLRFFHGARGLSSLTITEVSQGLNVPLGAEGSVSSYTNVPVRTYQFRVTSPGRTFDFTVPESVWTETQVYTAFVVQDVDDNQLLILQDTSGNTTTIRQRGELRAINLLSNTQASPANVQVSIDGTPEFSEIPFADPTDPISIEANAYSVEFNDNVFGGITRGIQVQADALTTVAASGLTDGTTQFFEFRENTSNPPATDEIAWRMYHGADRFGNAQQNSQINVRVLTDSPVTDYNQVNVGQPVFGGDNFLTRENTGLTIGVDVDPPSMDPQFELIFEIGELNDGESYTFILTRVPPGAPSPSGGPVVLYAFSDEGDSLIIGARSQASVFHLSPDTGAVDVHIDGDTTPDVESLQFADFSDDFVLESGDRAIDVVEEDAGLGSSLAATTAKIAGGEAVRQTAVFFGSGMNRQLAVFSNTPATGMQAPADGEVAIRVIHAAQGFDAVNLYDHTDPQTQPLLLTPNQPVAEGTASGYLTLPFNQAVTLGVDVVATNSQSPNTEKSDYFFQVADLQNRGQYNLIVGYDPDTGDVYGFIEQLVQPFTSPHQVLRADPLARVRVFHGAPFTGSVGLDVNGSPSPISGLSFESASRWVAVSPGSVDFDIVPSAIGTSTTVVVESGRSYTLAFATIGPDNILTVVEDDFAGINGARLRGVHLVNNPLLAEVDVLSGSSPPFSLVFENVRQGEPSATSTDIMAGTSLQLSLDLDDDLTPDSPAFLIPPNITTNGMHLNLLLYSNTSGGTTPVALLADGFVQTL